MGRTTLKSISNRIPNRNVGRTFDENPLDVGFIQFAQYRIQHLSEPERIVRENMDGVRPGDTGIGSDQHDSKTVCDRPGS